MSRLAIVTATTNLQRAWSCIKSWEERAETPPRLYLVRNGAGQLDAYDAFDTKHFAGVFNSHDYLGTVPAFRQGIDMALQQDAEIIAALHDDLEILEDGWDAKVLRYFDRHPAMGLAGFGGAIGLGAHDLYDKPYDPMSLARIGFRSDLVDAEVHGLRSLLAEPVACLDGFSQVGRRAFWEGATRRGSLVQPALDDADRPWTFLERLGVRHHCYDSALGALAARYGWETWYIPLRAKHHGGQTAVGDPGYQEWAKTQHPEGDHGFWLQAHEAVYREFKDQLPLRVIRT